MNLLNPKILASKIYPDAIIPFRKHINDAGYDIFAYSSHFTTSFHHIFVVETGIRVRIPEGYVGRILPKSRSNYMILAGVVDAGYTGELKVKIYSCGQPVTILKGDAIAQLVVMPIVITDLLDEVPDEVISSEKTDRGETGGING